MEHSPQMMVAEMKNVLAKVAKVMQDAAESGVALRPAVVSTSPSGHMLAVRMLLDESGSITEPTLHKFTDFDTAFKEDNPQTRERISEILAEHFKEGQHKFIFVME